MTRSNCYGIRDMSYEFGVSTRTLRFYEDKGLIAPARKGLQRIYTHRDRARLALIMRGKRLGFSLAEIREWLDLYRLQDGEVAQARRLVDVFRERVTVLLRQREDIEATINELEAQMTCVDDWLRRREDGRDAGITPGERINPATRLEPTSQPAPTAQPEHAGGQPG